MAQHGRGSLIQEKRGLFNSLQDANSVVVTSDKGERHTWTPIMKNP
jgi:hypothetical protein